MTYLINGLDFWNLNQVCLFFPSVLALVVVEAAFQQLFHLSRRDCTRVGTGAGIAYGNLGNLWQLIHEFLLVDDAAFVFADAGRDVQLFVHLVDVCNPVSYTHLDVYKRQDAGGVCFVRHHLYRLGNRQPGFGCFEYHLALLLAGDWLCTDDGHGVQN